MTTFIDERNSLKEQAATQFEELTGLKPKGARFEAFLSFYLNGASTRNERGWRQTSHSHRSTIRIMELPYKGEAFEDWLNLETGEIGSYSPGKAELSVFKHLGKINKKNVYAVGKVYCEY